MLHLWCQGAALLLALLFESLYSGFSGGRRTSFLHSIILNRPTADNSSFFILHSSFFILHSNCCIALCEPAATELESKNAHGISRIFSESFHGFVFWFFLFDFLLTWIVPWQDKWDFRRIFLLIVPCRTRGIVDGLWCEGMSVRGESLPSHLPSPLKPR